MKITANSLKGQLDQLDKQFQLVEATAKSFETLNGKASVILHTALHQVFEFGEALLSIQPQPGVDVTREFLVKHNVAYNARTKANPYIGLLKLAFTAKGNDSSRSQYATVLGYAASLVVDPKDFPTWLAEKGIEGWRSEALDAQNSKGRASRNRGRQTAVQNAFATLMAKPASASVTLPAGIEAPEGFALVLAKIDGSNGAQIIEVIHSDPAKVEPILLSLVDAPVVASNEKLAPFFRAIDLIINTTPDATQGKPRNLLIRNQTKRGKRTAIIEAVSEAYSFPGASMTLEGHVGELPIDKPFLIDAADARYVSDQFDKLSNWTLDSSGALIADTVPRPIQLTEITDAAAYRVAQALPCPEKPLQAPARAFEEVAGYIARERLENKQKNLKRSEPKAFPASVGLSIHDTKLSIRLPNSVLFAGLGETSAETDFGDKTIAVNDIEAVASTLARHAVDATGWIMDGDVDDAALVLEVHFDNDLLRIVMPTRTGSDYNQVCEALAL
ncbi:hypothetical protein C8J42_102509 [Sphingomonas sp. PP-CE-1A-559]|uniref:hypothetical protein n=1 Tax=Sphingomonas sp. PP-CE-1A-559 TaxID=2135657 RepID=UPI001055E1C5|nr:hypothetical protein [Sphingomonas sp. PP-CE-1A-559]TCP92733.1 hypothetical protein C8J42_102509 [Sphingomonas sp. PP-CE-1A-559]